MRLENLIYNVSKKRENLFMRDYGIEITIEDLKEEPFNTIYFFDTSILNYGIHVLKPAIEKLRENKVDEVKEDLSSLVSQLDSINHLTNNEQIIVTSEIADEVKNGELLFKKLVDLCEETVFDDSEIYNLLGDVYLQYGTLLSNLNTEQTQRIEQRIENYYLPRYKNSNGSVLSYEKKTGKNFVYKTKKIPSDIDLKLYLSAYLFNQKNDIDVKIVTSDTDIIVQGMCGIISSKLENAPKIIYPIDYRDNNLNNFSEFSLVPKTHYLEFLKEKKE